MIEANELRIGNWFMNKPYRKNSKPSYCQFGKEWFILFGNYGEDYVNGHLLPIPLTPEILEKCLYVGKTKNSKVEFERIENGVSFTHALGTIEIKFLHQLQNLFFALTGKELEVNL